MSLLSAIDRLLYARLTRGWPEARIDNYMKTLRVDDEAGALPNVVSRTFELIDAKAAALLTHTSMMVAALGVTSAVVAESRVEEAVIVAEITFYLLIAVLCLRCTSIFHEPPDENLDALSVLVRDELIIRRGLYTFCNRAAIYVTIVVFVSLPALFLYVAGPAS